MMRVFWLFVMVCLGNCIVIDTQFGEMEGNDGDGIYSFLNIPYAEPPINENRFNFTKPFKNGWNGTYDATSFGYACVQTKHETLQIETSKRLSEDCLYLNIWTPYNFRDENDSLRNVMVFIHGGWLSYGSGNWFDGTSIVKSQDIVFVSVNYRLNLAGWFPDLELLPQTGSHGGANGFLDMIEALKWIKQNIHSFGGNKDEVTISGESGGSWATCALLVSPLAQGLFKRAIQMSGSCIQSLGKLFDVQETMNTAIEVQRRLNLTTHEEIKTNDMQEMVNMWNERFGELLPSIDGYVIPKDPLELFKQGICNAETVVIGTIFREDFILKPFHMGTPVTNEDEWNAYLSKYLTPKHLKLINNYYPNDKNILFPYGPSISDNNIYTMKQSVFTSDCMFKCGSLLEAELIINNTKPNKNVDVYFYQLGYINEPIDQITHAYDLLLLTGKRTQLLSADVQYNDTFMKITQNFYGSIVKNNIPKPNNNDDIKGTLNNGYYMEITNDIHFINQSKLDTIRHRCQVFPLLIDTIYRSPVCMGINTQKPPPPKETKETKLKTEL